MKVLHVYRTYFPDPPGGLQEAIRQICLSTKPLGVESRVFTLSKTPSPSIIHRDEADVYRCKSYIAPASCDLSGISCIKEFKKLVEWADVVNFHFPWPFADILNLFISEKKPKVMTYHSDIVRQKLLGEFYKPLMKRSLKSMDAVVATSDNYARASNVLNSFVDKDKLHIIPLGITDTYNLRENKQAEIKHILEKYSLEEGKFALTIGVLRYYKGFRTLVEAAKSSPYKIVIGGSGPECENLKRQVELCGLTNVIFTGQLSELEKFVLLNACGVFVLPSHLRSEAFGMVLVEASMYKKPMISCEIGTGTSFVNKNDETGIVIEPESPHQLAEAINRLIGDASLANQYGSRARERFIELFSDVSLGNSYQELYKNILNSSIKSYVN